MVTFQPVCGSRLPQELARRADDDLNSALWRFRTFGRGVTFGGVPLCSQKRRLLPAWCARNALGSWKCGQDGSADFQTHQPAMANDLDHCLKQPPPHGPPLQTLPSASKRMEMKADRATFARAILVPEDIDQS
jgi:hypothetical protein